MTNPFANPSDFASSTNFFRPQELSLALAVLIETKSILENQVREFKGVQTGVGTDTISDLTVFENQAQLDGTQPPVVLKGVRIDKDAIVNTLKSAFDAGNKVMVSRVVKATSQKTQNKYWSLDNLDPASVEKVAAYYNKRAEAAASAPSFDD